MSLSEEQDVVQVLRDDVRRTTDSGSAHAFRPHLRRYLVWRRSSLRTTPPVLPLLALFSLAAEQMGSGDGMSPTNYYARLVHLIGGDVQSVAASYRDVAERLWGGLNLWLERNEGERGLPTAFALGHRHVGLAVSQALVRETDRERLHLFFEQFGLSPTSVVPPQELDPLLDSWIRTSGSAGISLARLWDVPLNRSVICEVAATELAEWSGAVAGRVARIGPQRARLVVSQRSFPRPRISTGILVPTKEGAQEATLLSARDGQPVTLPLEPFREGLALLGENDSFDSADLLTGLMRVEVEGVGEVRRSPQGVVVFKHDDLSNTWIETARVLLGDSLMLLARRDRMPALQTALEEMARPGWSVRDAIAGLPEDWVQVAGIEIFGRPVTRIPESSDLAALIPLTTRQLQLAGGLKVPGRVRNRWHVARAPELRAVSDEVAGFSIALIDLGAEVETSDEALVLETWSSDASNSVVKDLADLDLAVGEYALVMQERDEKAATSRLSFSLRSSDAPDEASWESAKPVQRMRSHPLAVVGAESGEGGRSTERRPESRMALEPLPWWRRGLREERAARIGLARPPAASCFYTGRHRMRIDTAPVDGRGRPLVATTLGRCDDCGTERSFSTNPRSAERAKERADREAAAALARSRVAERPAIRQNGESDDLWTIALDLLVYFGGGDYDLLQRVANEVADGAQFAAHFVRVLEGLGHISVARSSTTLQPERWHIDPRGAIRTGPFLSLIGAWSDNEVKAVLAAGAASAGDPDSGRTTIRTFTDAPPEIEERALHASAKPLVGEALLGMAATMQETLAALPRTSPPSTQRLERFDPNSASWIETYDISSVGAYRTTDRRRRHYVRTQVDLRDGTAATIDTYGAKHAASVLLTGRALAAYHHASRELIVPIGADLPVLYDRAVVAETQRPPFVRRGFAIYADVSAEVAGRLGYLLTH
ncbi:hypothetical protein [Amnibacterium sp.]|uniref:hypothetical protein n=1 Tax=Amnibacterium sp. TaxID=1872496 RepID=UPI003F7C1309